MINPFVEATPVRQKQGAYLNKGELFIVLGALEQLRNESGLYPDQLTLYYKLLAVFYGH